MKQKFLLLFVVYVVIISCEWDPFEIFAEHFYDDSIYLKNNSEINIGFYVSNIYPDTILDAKKPDMTMVEPGKERYIQLNMMVDTPLNWKKSFPRDTVTVFVLDYEITEQLSWNTVRDNYMILKRYEMDVVELRNMEYKITYP